VKSYVLGKIKENALKTLMLSVAVLVLAVIVTWYNFNDIYRYYYNVFKGPFTVSGDDLKDYRHSKEFKYFLSVKGDNVADSGFYLRVTEKRGGIKVGDHIGSKYYILKVGERFMFVEGDPGKIKKEYTGELTSLPDRLMEEISKTKNPGIFRPFMLSESNAFKRTGYIYLFSAFWGIVIAFYIIKFSVDIIKQPQTHSDYESLSCYGAPAEIDKKITDDMNDSDKKQFSNIILTKNWIVQNKLISITVLSIEDVMWVYKIVKKQGLFLKEYALAIVFTGGRSMMLKGSLNKIDSCVKYIAGKMPWVIMGYNSNVANAWKNQNKEFVSTVEERKRKIRAGESLEKAAPQNEAQGKSKICNACGAFNNNINSFCTQCKAPFAPGVSGIVVK